MYRYKETASWRHDKSPYNMTYSTDLVLNNPGCCLFISHPSPSLTEYVKKLYLWWPTFPRNQKQCVWGDENIYNFTKSKYTQTQVIFFEERKSPHRSLSWIGRKFSSKVICQPLCETAYARLSHPLSWKVSPFYCVDNSKEIPSYTPRRKRN